jgi:predicted SAM-dependent methyltransferase
MPILKSQKYPYKLLLRVLPLHLWRPLRYEFALTMVRLRSRRARRSLFGATGLLLNVGPGERAMQDWVNIDAHDGPGVTCVFDCRTALPVEPGSARAIYAEHFLEHLDRYSEAPLFLAACRQAILPGGVLRIVVPDAEKYVRAYCASGWEEMVSFSPLAPPPEERMQTTKMDILNHHFRQGYEHKWAYDYETLAALILDVGFKHVARSDYNESAMRELRIDSPQRRSESLYVEAFV